MPSPNPFDLTDNDAYRCWRDAKLSAYPKDVSELIVELDDLGNPTMAEQTSLMNRCLNANMAIYASRPGKIKEDRVRENLLSFARTFGLRRTEKHRSADDDGIVTIEMAADPDRKGYIPYSNRPLSWHSDGYYNAPEDRIRAFLLHCVHDAEEGGENKLLDPELAYIRLRDENPEYIFAFMRNNAMTIPANAEGEGKTRAESIGPVFSQDPATGKLHMRYTARSRNIVWHDSQDTQAAVRFLNGILADGDPQIFRLKLKPGQGLICNNVLHCRTGFKNASAHSKRGNRLLYRLRYLDDIAFPRGRELMFAGCRGEEKYGQTQ